ncbi:hypothetical protein HZH68_016254 [Vespula germanica]|uniref:Uncharacterized protein n=1 Tax=Vespula germanica TaxID=30212 RepID=A0A834MQY4_VESGE|nr:hypothetical protein HZH68_016254 [Vespula germanica]
MILQSRRVFLLIIEFITNPPNSMEAKLTREAPNNRLHWIVKAKEVFKKKLKNLTEERIPLAVAHRLSVLKSSDIDRLQHDVTIEIGLILNNHYFTLQPIVGYEEEQEVLMEECFTSDVKCLTITFSIVQIHVSSLDVIRIQTSFNSDPLQYFGAIGNAFAFG